MVNRQRLRTAVKILRRPSDMAIAARTAFWMCFLPVLKRVLPLPKLVRLMWRPAKLQTRSRESEAHLAQLVKRLCRVSGGNCLERSLILYRFLAHANAEPRLVVALARPEGRFLGHVWVTVDGQALFEAPAVLLEYTEFVVFGAAGIQEPRLPMNSSA
jgi:Transglutaminase-like superfamily